MPASSPIHVFDLALDDADRGLREQLAFRVARHPSETLDHLLTRVLAYCLEWEEGLRFSPGLSTRGVPALWTHDATGRVRTWIEVGAPDAERLDKAARVAERVAVYTWRDPAALRRQLARRRIHRADQIRLCAVEPGFLTALGAQVGRRTRGRLSRVGARLELEIDGQRWATTLRSGTLSEPGCALFAYGTLELPEVFEAVTGMTLRGEQATLADFRRGLLHACPYPGVLPAPGARTAGVLYRGVDAACLAHLDRFEGTLYERREVHVTTRGGRRAAAQTYVLRAEYADRLTAEPWRRERFVAQHLPAWLEQCRGFRQAEAERNEPSRDRDPQAPAVQSPAVQTRKRK